MPALTATGLRAAAQRALATGQPAIVVHVQQAQGSTPRATDARMIVSPTEVMGTIGGGHLEWQAVQRAREALGRPPSDRRAWVERFALGPSLGQCCGGVVHLAFAPLDDVALSDWPQPAPRFGLDLHGAGHVGQAIVHLLATLDVDVRWIDQRLGAPEDPGDPAAVGLPEGAARAALPPHIACLPTDGAAAEAASAPDQRLHLVLTHRHDLDLAIVDALLRRPDVRQGQAWVGLIGSRTKRAAFEHRLAARGHPADVVARMACPIGIDGIAGKAPEVIAVSVVAQLLLLSST